MEQIPLNEDNWVVVRAAGDVCIRGWEKAEMRAVCDRESLAHTQQQNGVVYVVSKSDLCLSVPLGVPVRVEHVSGDAFISGLGGRLEVQKVGGDLSVERCGDVNLGITSGDLMLREINGPVVIQKVGGDLNGEALAQGLTVEQVGGDASFRAGVGVQRVRAGGDLKLYLPGQGSEEVTLHAGGDIDIYVDAGINAQLELTSGGHDIDIDVNGCSSQIEAQTHSAALGEGGALVRARAGGDIRVIDAVWDEDSLSEEFADLAADWEGWCSAVEGKNDESMDIEGQIQRNVDESVRRAEKRVNEAMKRVERQNKRHQDIFSRFGIRWGNFWSTDPQAPNNVPDVNVNIPPIQIPKIDVQIPEIIVPGFDINLSSKPSQPATTKAGETADAAVNQTPGVVGKNTGGVSHEERMQVLKMLREHKISVDEAEELLRALSGDVG